MAFFKKELTVLAADVTGGPLTDFSLLVSITDSDLQKNARSDGFDIFFTESDETTVIPYDRELYDSTTGELIAWVLVDLSDTTDNTFFMFYGDPDQTTDQQDSLPVWANFEDVFHFNQTSPLPWTNSSVGKNFTLNVGTTVPIPVVGQIDSASDSSMDIGTSIVVFRMAPTVDVFPTDFFVSAWIKYDVIATDGAIFYDSWNSNGTRLAGESQIIMGSASQPNSSTIELAITDGSLTEISIGDMSDLVYHHVAIRYLSGTFDLFFDGSFVSSTSYTFTTMPNFDATQCGGGGGTPNPQNGRIDQLQVAYTGNFTNGFITTSFDNQKTTGQGAGNFVKIGVQQINSSNNYLLLSQGAISEESSSIINAICGDSSLKIGDTVRLLPLGTGEGFTQSDDLLPRVGIPDEVGASSYGVVVGGDFEGAYGIDPNADILSLGLIAAFFGDGVRICTQGKCLAFTDGSLTSPINIGDGLTATDSGLILASGTQRVIARALQTASFTNTIIAINVQREGESGTIPIGDFMLYEDIDIMEYEDFIDMDYET